MARGGMGILVVLVHSALMSAEPVRLQQAPLPTAVWGWMGGGGGVGWGGSHKG